MLISTTSLLGTTESSQIECSTSSSFGSASVSGGGEAVVISARGQSSSSSGASSAVSDYGAAEAEACTIVYENEEQVCNTVRGQQCRTVQ